MGRKGRKNKSKSRSTVKALPPQAKHSRKPPPDAAAASFLRGQGDGGGARSTAVAVATVAKATVEEKRIDKRMIATLPLIQWNGPIIVLKDRDEMKKAVEVLLKDDILGFDTETRPVFRKGEYQPPALVQLANKECAYLFQILCGGLDILTPLLEANHVTKVGVAIKGDIKALQKVHRFKPGGFVELSDRTKKLGYHNTGLRALTALIMGRRLSKQARMSNWAKPDLKDKQKVYAATDAWIGRELYLRVLEEERVWQATSEWGMSSNSV